MLADVLSRTFSSTTLSNITVAQLIRDKTAPETIEERMRLINRAHRFGHFGEIEVFKKLWYAGYWSENIRQDIKSN